MYEIGSSLTLAELITRSQADNAFTTATIEEGLLTVLYQKRGKATKEYWQAVPETDHLVLKRILPTSPREN